MGSVGIEAARCPAPGCGKVIKRFRSRAEDVTMVETAGEDPINPGRSGGESKAGDESEDGGESNPRGA